MKNHQEINVPRAVNDVILIKRKNRLRLRCMQHFVYDGNILDKNIMDY